MQLILNEVIHGKTVPLRRVELSEEVTSIGGLREASRYCFALDCDVAVAACIDDLRLEALPGDASWIWDSGFCVGAARLEFVDSQGVAVATVLLQIASDDGKLSESALGSMLDDLLRWAPEKVAGDSQTFVALGGRGTFAANVRYERIRRYGPLFIDALDDCQRNPHVSFEPGVQHISIERVKRPSRRVLSDHRVIAYCASMASGAHDRPPPVVRAAKISSSVDTLANRSLLTQTKKVLLRVESLREVLRAGLADADDAEWLRSQRRIRIVEGIASALKRSISWFLRSGVREGQEFADGLAQMSRIAAYSRAVRSGKLACSESFSILKENEAALPLNSSWGLYEQWCFEQTRRLIETLTGIPAPRIGNHFGAQTEACVFQSRGVKITLAAQVTFPSGAALSEGATRHSLSKERRPDTILIVEGSGSLRWYIFDAKYRQNKANVLDAMSSAHIYRDSLLFHGTRCTGAFLLTPGAAFNSMWTLFSPDHWDAFGTGAVPGFRPDGEGLALMTNLIADILGKSRPDLDDAAARSPTIAELGDSVWP